MSAQKYKQQLFEAILNLLWKQWTALGVPGQISASDSEMILDPEALMLFSADFSRYDQRLYDLILDWLQIHSSQINIQRLKALHAKAGWKDTASLGYMAAVLAESDSVRWKKPASDYAGKNPASPAALFRNQDNEPETFIPRQDPLALRCGFLRNIRQNSGKIPFLLPENAATLLLRMRGLLGISARVETVLILLSSGPCKVQEIVDRSGFQWKSIQDVLGELSAGNFVNSIHGNTRGKQYFLAEPEKLLKFFEIRNPDFAAWLNIYDSIGLLWTCCSNPALAEVSEETFQNELRNLYHEKIQSKLLDAHHPIFQQQNLNLMDFSKMIDML